jgi:mono/diheme cytochrome c family protein
MKTFPACLLLATVVSLTVAVSALAQSEGSQSEVPPSSGTRSPVAAGDAVNGKRVFFADGCFYCHGTTGAGGGNAGPRLAPNPLPLEGVRAKLRTASGRMPVYSPAVLKDAEIAAIVAYLQSIPQGKPAKDIPALNR